MSRFSFCTSNNLIWEMTIANLTAEGCPLEAPGFENLLVEDLLFECVILFELLKKMQISNVAFAG